MTFKIPAGLLPAGFIRLLERVWGRARAPLASLALALLLMVVLGAFNHGPLMEAEYSTVVFDRDGKLLGATVAGDGQWRFPPDLDVPSKFRTALVEYEDRRFYYHRGVDPAALVRALFSNVKAGDVVSGGSTLTMQLIRISRGNPDRTFVEKAVEAVLALRLELFRTKDQILRLYAAYAPFGGNVVGLDAASWRYFGRSPDALSWAEAATLAVLPNSPGLIRPDRNRDELRRKRDALLARLEANGVIGSEDYQLALAEALPDKPKDLPREAPHLVDRIRGLDGGEYLHRVQTSVNLDIQRRVNATMARHRADLAGNGVKNAAVLVLDVRTGGVLAYAGNYLDGGDFNDMVFAPRSTGSVMKPFLYAAQLDAGELLPTQLVPDIPTRFSGFAPENNTMTYEGAVPADQALARSLNIPAVRNLRSYGLHRFYDLLKTLGMSTLFRPADMYGLPLIIGGAEGNLWELTHMYADLARGLLKAEGRLEGQNAGWGVWPLIGEPWGGGAAKDAESAEDADAPQDVESVRGAGKPLPQSIARAESYRSPDGRAYPYGPASIYLTMQALSQVLRPDEEGAWEDFISSHPFAWKTGTSFGFRDAWAIGVNDRFAIGVWVGNSSGEGRPELRGYSAAAPLFFDVVSGLPRGGWFEPTDDLVGVTVSSDSGYLAGPDSPRTTRILAPPRALSSQVDPYSRLVHLDASGRFQADSASAAVGTLRSVKWFVLPPDLEWYYRRAHANYRTLPPWLPGQGDKNAEKSGTGIELKDSGEGLPFGLVFPSGGSRIYVPVDLDGTPGMTVFQATHRDPKAVLYWHLDGDYLGSTREIHQMEARPGPGLHTLVLVDASGRRLERQFTVLSK